MINFENGSIYDILRDYFRVTIEPSPVLDNIPTKLCSDCEVLIIKTMEFIDKARRSADQIKIQRKTSIRPKTSDIFENYTVQEQAKVETPKFACDVCNETFTRKYNLQRHEMKHLGKKNFGCGYCQKSFLRLDYLKVHLENHAKRIGKTQEGIDLKTHMKIHTGVRGFACHICKMQFGSKDIMLNHVRTHKKDRPFQCTLCKKSFKQRATLIGHRGIHFDDVYTCKICEMEFGKRNEARTHVSLYHPESNMRDVIEQVPKKKSSSRKSKPRVSNRKNSCRYICDKCGKKFLSKQGVIYHLKEHFGVLEYACSFCPRSFGSVEKLKEHIMLHSKDHPLERLVSKSSATKDDFQVRVLIHTVDRPHKCPTCDKGFKRHVQLISHVETHKLTS